MKKSFSVLFALALCSSVALASTPYPPNCTVSPCNVLNGAVICPDGPSPIASSIVTVTVRNQANNPMPNMNVNVTFGSGPLCICPSMVFNATTNQHGVAILTLRGGGCISNLPEACVFRANGIVIGDYPNVKSPDWDGASGNCAVNLTDLVRFAPGTDLCFDFNNNGSVDVSDLIIFVSGFSPSHHCP